MRLSWYANTGVAVFSIWQGGTCTGTFRLPIADLPRMVETLQRGPRRAAPRDEGITGQQPAAREPRRAGPPDPARPPRPDLPDRDIETGQTTATIYAPSGDPDLTGYRADPGLTGYRADPGLTGYRADPGLTGYRADPGLTGYQADPALAGPGSADPAMADHPGGPPGGYRHRPGADGETDDPDGPLPPRAGRRGKPSRRRRGPPPSAPGLTDQPARRHRDGDLADGQDEYLAGLGTPDFTSEYPAGPLAADPPGEYYQDEPAPPEFTGQYRADPLAPDPPGRRGSRRSRQDQGGPGGDQSDGPGGYPTDPVAGDPPGRYPAGSPAPDHRGGYPSGPLASDRPDGYEAGPGAPGFTGDLPAGPGAPDSTDGLPAGPEAPDSTDGLPADPGAPGPSGGRGSHRRGRDRGDGPGDYPADPAHGYLDEPADRYPGEPANGYRGGEETPAPGYPEPYQDDPLDDRPGGPADDPRAAGYPGEDYQGYPEDPDGLGYDSPERPYEPGEPLADDRPGRRKPRGRRSTGPTTDSFPYGQPPRH